MTTDAGPVRCGIRTSIKTMDRVVYLHVDWIDWDSGFRDTGLRVGDHILAVDDDAVIEISDDGAHNQQVGRDQEATHWQAKGAADGQPVKLSIRRRRIPGVGWDKLAIDGKARAERHYTSPDGRRLIGEAGPERLAKDDFPDSWASWIERRMYVWERQVGDDGIWSGSADTRMALKDHLADEARVKFLQQRYPGPFSRAVASDWEAIRDLLAGRSYTVDPDELRFREEEDKIVEQATAAAKAAWADFCERHKADIIEPPGPLSVVDGGIEHLAGKLLLLPPSAPANWITDVGVPFVAWNLNKGWIVTPLQSPNFDRAWRAQMRYRHNVTPGLNDAVSIIGRILPEMRMIRPSDDAGAVIGVEVVPVAAMFGDDEIAMFAELGGEEREVSFAGESEIRALPIPAVADDATPQQVMEALFDALHARDDKTWLSLFAEWQVLVEDGWHFYNPYDPYPEMRRDPDWIRSRRLVLEKVAALRVAWADDPTDITPYQFPGMPKIERVLVEIDHVGEFNGAYATFNSSDVQRRWRLGRLDGGPWRIISFQGV